ncbi:MAG: MBL fold metallo-hydrolase [Chloroflexota bacterium]|nr:MAG: MBL fold metallo-hydrolase [Chloroflexota bacterium]
MEVIPGIHQLRLPIPGSSLGVINAYLVRGEDGYLLVDTGWDAKDSFASLQQQLAELGVQLTDIKTILVTHIHPDHYGLAGRIKRLSGAEIVIHQMETSFIESRYHNWEGLIAQVAAWLRINGMPEQDLDRIARASLNLLDYVHLVYPDRTLSGGEIIEVGGFRFEVIWTPGHASGHICLYEPHKRVLLSGDHVLPGITPIVTLHLQNIGNPLADYVTALKAVSRLDVDIVLPAHEQIFYDLPKRVDEILCHHDVRMEHMLQAIGDTPRTAYEIARSIPWRAAVHDWNDLLDWEKKATIFETLAHLELMNGMKRIEKICRRGVVYYGPSSRSL